MDDTVVTKTIANEWDKAWNGEEPTASTLESGIPPVMQNRPEGQVLAIDVVTRTQKAIASGVSFGQLLLSPDKLHLALLKQVSVSQPNPNKRVTMLYPAIYQLLVVDLQGAFHTST